MPSWKTFRDSSSFEESEPLSAEEGAYQPSKSESKGRKFRTSTIFLSLSTLILGSHSLYTLLRPSQCRGPSYLKGYNTEWDPPKSAITLDHQVTFGSRIKYNETSQTYYRETDATKPQYVGKPSKEIDDAWEDLLSGQYVYMYKNEALKLEDPEMVSGRYVGQVEVMHNLHCLNAVRQALYPDYYKDDPHHSMPILEKYKDIHLEHCVDQIRQSIQCHGDLTPLLLRGYGEGDNSLLIGSPQTHTCRNWDSLRSWYTERGKKHGVLDAHTL